MAVFCHCKTTFLQWHSGIRPTRQKPSPSCRPETSWKSIKPIGTKAPQFLGIDVGTGSARAGVFSASGKMLGSASQPIQMWKPQPDFVEQSSEDIWSACCRAVREAMGQAGALASDIAGIGFDATCSLVVLDDHDQPVSISPSGCDAQNVIAWMDNRSIEQAEQINQAGHRVLRYVGNVISPEMQTPKLFWLKENMPATWKRAARFFDLPDYLTYRATGDETRSLCTTVCKWTYLGQKGLDGAGWDTGYFRKIGLGDLVDEGFKRIGTRIRPMGEALCNGLTVRAAAELGLNPGTPVGVSIIDAHAGGLGMLGVPEGNGVASAEVLESRLALIGGTSSCHMAVSPIPRFIRGIWGPYYSAMIPGLWLTEGGQSATGALIDHVIFSHAAAAPLQAEAKAQNQTIYELLNARLENLAREQCLPDSALLTRNFHIQPDFHGNRSPRATPTLRGTMTGLPLSATADDLARQYLAAIQSVAYGTRHILEEMNKKGYEIRSIMTCGGGTKNPVFLREHADITGCKMILPREPEAVLLGSAVLGAVSSGTYSTVLSAMNAMNATGKNIKPRGGKIADYHATKLRVFHRMHSDFLAYRRIMATT
ncbi:MAG: FGGY-family carbohydrate kinase [Chthoniobacteraceae bacterium]